MFSTFSEPLCPVGSISVQAYVLGNVQFSLCIHLGRISYGQQLLRNGYDPE